MDLSAVFASSTPQNPAVMQLMIIFMKEYKTALRLADRRQVTNVPSADWLSALVLTATLPVKVHSWRMYLSLSKLVSQSKG